MTEIIIPSSDDIVTINRKLGGAILNPGSIDFLIAKIESKTPKKDYKRQIAIISGMKSFRATHSLMGIKEPLQKP